MKRTDKTLLTPLDALLTRVARNERRRRRVIAVSDSLLWLILVVVTALVVDAARPLGPVTRLVIGSAVIVLIAVVILRSPTPRALRGASPLRWARRLERDLQIPSNALVNAWSLRPVAGSAEHSLTTTLASRAVQRGDDLAEVLTNDWRPDHPRVRRSIVRLGVTISVCTILTMFTPRLVTMGAPRLIDPFGDHPPFTRLDFDIQIQPARGEIVLGDDVTIEVVIHGSDGIIVPDLVIAGSDRNESVDRKPMTAVDSTDRFATTLVDLDDAVTVYIDTPEGRSSRFEICPIAAPRVVDLRLEVSEPPYAVNPRTTPVQGTDKPIEAHIGGAVRAVLTTSLPLQSAGVSTGRESIPLAVTQETASGSAPVFSPGETTWSFNATAADSGLELISPVGMTIIGLPDTPPELKLTAPPRNAAAAADQPLPIRGVARDDLGLVGVVIDWKINRGGRIVANGSQSLTEDAPAARSVDSIPPLNPSALGAQPGDLFSFVVRATDGRPPDLGGPQSVETEPYLVRILAPELYGAWAEARGHLAESAPPDAGSISGSSEDSDDSERATQGAPSGKTPETAPSNDREDPAPSEDPAALEALDDYAARGALYGSATPDGRVHGGSDGALREDQPDTMMTGDIENPGFAGRTSVVRGAGEEHDDLGSPESAGSAREAPARYRELVRRYFERIAREEDENP